MRRELISILCIHLSARLEHPLVHLPVLAHACIELKGIHASFLEDVLSHALFRIDVNGRLRHSLFNFLFFFRIFRCLFYFYSVDFLILVVRNFLPFHFALVHNYWFRTINLRIFARWCVLVHLIPSILAVVLNDYLAATRGGSWKFDGYLLGRLIDFNFWVKIIAVGIFWWVILRCVWSVFIALIWIRLGAWAGLNPNYLVIHWF